jgi:hypothetical protein
VEASSAGLLIKSAEAAPSSAAFVFELEAGSVVESVVSPPVCSFDLSSEAPLYAGTFEASSGFFGTVLSLFSDLVESSVFGTLSSAGFVFPLLSSPVVSALPSLLGSVVFEPLSSAAGLTSGLSAGLSDF